MAKIELNPLLGKVQGAIGGIILKRYGDRTVASKYPDMSRVKSSPLQLAQQERMKWAIYYYRHVLGDPTLKARYEKRAKAKKTTTHRLATSEYMRLSIAAGRVDILAELTGPKQQAAGKAAGGRKAKR